MYFSSRISRLSPCSVQGGDSSSQPPQPSLMEENLPQTNAIDEDNNKQIILLPRRNDIVEAKKKQRSGNQLLRVASSMVRRKSAAKLKPGKEDVASKGVWKRFVDSMRPLHLQSNVVSPKHPIAALPSPTVITPTNEQFEDVLSSPIDRIRTSFSCSSLAEGSSRYASANNLQELDPTAGNDDEIQNSDEDVMIDDKAEKFIAYFYEQMRLQRMDSYGRRYDDWHTRSIG